MLLPAFLLGFLLLSNLLLLLLLLLGRVAVEEALQTSC
jgi:hypothetical protein